jgi:MFS transporter, PAT family, beta-lactamase induction signal transducer AmpG
VPPYVWVATLYFAEGLPTTVIGTLSAIILKQMGVSNVRIAMCVSAFMLPWTLRPLWSPLLELVGTKRAFVIATELVIALGFVGIALSLGAPHGAAWCISLFGVIALSAATHDMAADGLYIRCLPPAAQQRYIGWLAVAFNVARLVVQGVLVVVIGRLALRWGTVFAWQIGFTILAVIAAALALSHARLLPHERPIPPRTQSLSGMATSGRDIVVSFFTKGGMLWLLALILLYRLAEGQVARIAPLFLLDPRGQGGLGLSTAEMGFLYGGIGGISFAGGAVLGGWIARRLGQTRAFVPLCLAFNLPALFYLALASTQPSLTVVAGVIAAEQLAFGVGSVGLKLATLSAAQGRYETAHCAFAGALSGVGAIVAGMLSGALQTTFGYFGFFFLAVLATLPPLAVASICARREVHVRQHPDSAA